MLRNVMVTAFTVYEVLRENQWEGGGRLKLCVGHAMF